MTAQTPGPWRISPPSGTDIKLVSIWAGKIMIADGVLPQDAPIIAAAPQLADALEMLFDGGHLCMCLNGQKGNDPDDRCSRACQRARAALRKADRGGSDG